MDRDLEAPTTPGSDAGDIDEARLEDDGTPESRYVVHGHLGRGGMGEVRLCDDRRIGREVAMKTARDDLDAPARARFLLEARVQARLEHPSIVPVYDVGLDRTGAPYFTMKRVRCKTLKSILRGLRDRDPEVVARYSLRRLLTSFASVCLAVHYAHTKDVLHRDLKPNNIMLDEYGELYVLDWGLAHVEGGDESAPDSLPWGGTPRYMAPEQLAGAAIDARADVYALGAILFEILCLEPLHISPDRDPEDESASVEGRPSARAPDRDVPPELDEICARATASAPADRYPSARELHDAVDRYLEGDRDLERRRRLSAEHARGAQEVAAEAFRSDDPASRARAMREVSRALAFDPNNEQARRVLLELLTVPPRELPREAREDMERRWYAQRQRMAKGGALLFLSWFVLTPTLLAIVGIGFTGIAYLQGVLFLAAAAALIQTARTPFEKRKLRYAPLVLTSLAISSASAPVGPLVLVPTLVVANAVAFLLQPDERRRFSILAMSCAAILLPLGMEWAGLVPRSYRYENGLMIVDNRWIPHTEVTFVAALVFTLGVIIAVAVLFARFRDMLTLAETRLSSQAWQLRQLVPEEQRD